jgi:DNA polymerase-3 subunit alpha
LIVDELIPLDELDTRYTHGMRIKLEEEAHGIETLTRLREILRGYPGKQEMLFSMKMCEGETVHMRSDKYKVEITPELRGRLDDLLGEGHYKLMMSRPGR